jgi:hypothetical protein
MKVSASHIGIFCVLTCYLAALYYLVPTFNPELVQPGWSNTVKHFMIAYGLGICCTYISRIFYNFEISIKFEALAGLLVMAALFTLVGSPLSPNMQ